MAKISAALFLTAIFFSYSSAQSEPYQKALSELKNKDPQIRRAAAEELGRLRNPEAKEALLKLLSDPEANVRAAAVNSLGILRIQSVSAEIAKLLETDQNPSVRQASAIALGYISDSSVISSLIKGIHDPHEGTRFACINSLGILRNPAAVEALAGELLNPDARIRRTASYALGNIADRRAVPFLMQALKIALSTAPEKGEENLVDPSVGASLLRSLGLISDTSVIPELKPYLNVPQKEVSIFAAQALFRLGDRSGIAVARKSVQEQDAQVRRIAAELLGEMGEARDLDTLKKMKSDSDSGVQSAAATAVEKLSQKISQQKSGTSRAKTAARPTAGGTKKKTP